MNMTRCLVAMLVCTWPLLGGAAGDHDHHPHGAASVPAAAAQRPWGKPAPPKSAQRTIEITMADNMRFAPALVEVKQGEIVKLVVRNQGKLLHELVIGTKKEFAAHAAAMAREPKMAHDEAGMAHVKPGGAGEIVWNFNRPGDFDFACLEAGHYEAGMTGRIHVTPAAR